MGSYIEVLLWLALPVALFVAAVLVFNKRSRIKRAMRRADCVPIKSVGENQRARVRGTLHYVGEPLTAPFSQRKCASYTAWVEESIPLNNSRSTKVIASEKGGVDFTIRDDGDTALIQHHGASTVISADLDRYVGKEGEDFPELVTFLERHGMSITVSGYRRSLRFFEGVLEAGEQVAVLGRGVREPSTDPRRATGSYREVSTQLVMRHSDESPLYISDDPSVLR